MIVPELKSPLSIAVVGSGIAGLAAAWHLGARHRVVLYEKHTELGMAAHGMEWGGARVDMPLRVIYRGYYPNLTALYADAGIGITSASYAGSFGDLRGRTYFRYRNLRLSRSVSLPLLQGGHPLGAAARHIVLDLMRMYLRGGRDLQTLREKPITLEAYARSRGFSPVFVEQFLLPTFAAIGTCDMASVRSYPAHVVLSYLRQGVLLEGVSRTEKGADAVVARLSSRSAELRLGRAIAEVRRHAGRLELRDAAGQVDSFDHVIMATQGNQALKLSAHVDPGMQRPLEAFRYQPSEVVVHTDQRLMPERRSDWSPVNFAVDVAQPRPEATIWLNSVLPVKKGTAEAFQTWNALREIDPAAVLARASFERPIVDLRSEQALSTMRRLQDQAGRQIWYCGSYAESGVPLLESAARSAREVAQRIDPSL